MKQITDLHKKYTQTDLPPIQTNLLKYNTVLELVQSPVLHRILNPCFSYHYCVDHVTPRGEVITTKDTSGYNVPWGDQSKNAEMNAFNMAQDIRALLVNNGAYLIGKKYFINIDNNQYRIIGMTIGNTKI